MVDGGQARTHPDKGGIETRAGGGSGLAAKTSRIAGAAAGVMLWSAAILCAQAPANAEPSVKAQIDQAAAAYFKDNDHATALSIGVVLDGQSRIFQYGTLARGKAQPPRPDTVFAIASITKTFTGTLLAEAVAEGRAAMSDDVRKYLDGDFPNLEFAGTPITLTDLVDHRSGLPFLLPDRPALDPGFKGDARPFALRVAEAAKGFDRRAFFEELHKVELTQKPGSDFHYSNMGAQLIGYVLEKIYRRPYEILLKEKIAAPLGMRDTVLGSVDDAPRTAPGWDENGLAILEPDLMPAAAGVKSSIADLLRYARWHLAEKDPAVILSHRPVFDAKMTPYDGKGAYGSALFWQVASLEDRRLIWQDGMVEGYSALCILEPEEKLALVIMTNELDPGTAHFNQILANRILTGLAPKALPLP
jgi:serine-type D-Ala-D-Ala carboxypeptidase/endopeptidase